MAKLICPCGNQLSNVQCPSGNNGWFVTDEDTDNQIEWDTCTVIEIGREVWECHDCGRVAFGNKKDAGVKWYEPADGKPGHLTKIMT